MLLIMADQLADPWLDLASALGGTPAIDRLAADGLRFTNAYSNSPLCAPARYAMLTGRLNSTIGAYDNAAELPAGIPTFAHHLRSVGYQTSLVGKMHFVGPDQLHGYEERLTTDIYPADFGWTPDWSDPDHRFDWWFHNMDSVVNAGVAEASNQLDFDDEVGFRSVRKLRDLARSSDDRPWFLTVSFTHPHDPYVARRHHWDRYDHDAIPLPTVATPADPDPHSRRLARVMAADTVGVTEHQVRNARHAYLANVSYVDDFVGQLLDALARLGQTDDTIVIFTADHGDLLGERGLWYKMSFFEASARVPVIIRGPGITAGTRSTAVSLLDLAPTLAHVAGAEPMPENPGGSLLDVADADDHERTVVGEYLGEGAVAPIVMIRRGSEKFVWSSADPPQLFDLAADPTELTNLAPIAPEVTARYEVEVDERWDIAGIDRAVRDSQAQRRLVDRALRQGHLTPWDHQPLVDASQQYMRNHLDLNDVEATRRL
ncbi:MAG: choline-sulfatase [Actinomycetota bacterium]